MILIMNDFHNRGKLTGKLFVTKSDKIEIDLGGIIPKRVHVKFADKSIIVPCNHQTDSVQWKISYGQTNKLVIEWDVSGLRVIRWNVSI